MPKTIVFCADGTWNGPGETDSDDTTATTTNVFRLFVNLDGRDTPDSALLGNEQERVLTDSNGVVLQWAKYLHGVGASDNFLVKVLGGTVGAGLIARIVRGYTFISRNYLPGDRIFIIGFSRGAYTARALAGLIATKGLLDPGKNDLTDKTNAYRLGSAVWYAYRRVALQANTDLLGRLQEAALDLPHFLSAAPGDDRLMAAPIEAVAVWDTVGSLGIPVFTVRAARIDAFQFADRKLSDKVVHGIHAIAVDEQRADFTGRRCPHYPGAISGGARGCRRRLRGGRKWPFRLLAGLDDETARRTRRGVLTDAPLHRRTRPKRHQP